MTVSDLDELLRDMRPMLSEKKYHMATVDESEIMAIAGYLDYLVCIYREDEGISIVFEEDILEEMNGLSEKGAVGPFARITLGVDSDLMAVGFLARVTEALAKEGISVNAFSAYHHDHLFVPYARKGDAMEVLGHLQKSSSRNI